GLYFDDVQHSEQRRQILRVADPVLSNSAAESIGNPESWFISTQRVLEPERAAHGSPGVKVLENMEITLVLTTPGFQRH
ncbi:hypothetical protein, partial [uncultured Corynebacterium sp.]|uniref:hypothetical protein n=1 Tax=uncultured Corynebacterium sp. TaxID=159447 RepID=UPI00259335D6